MSPRGPTAEVRRIDDPRGLLPFYGATIRRSSRRERRALLCARDRDSVGPVATEVEGVGVDSLTRPPFSELPLWLLFRFVPAAAALMWVSLAMLPLTRLPPSVLPVPSTTMPAPLFWRTVALRNWLLLPVGPISTPLPVMPDTVPSRTSLPLPSMRTPSGLPLTELQRTRLSSLVSLMLTAFAPLARTSFTSNPSLPAINQPMVSFLASEPMIAS